MTPQEARALWVERLESGAIQQSYARLGKQDGSRCCLGVLCDIAVELGVIEEYNIQYGNLDEYPAVRKMVGLRDSEGRYKEAWSEKQYAHSLVRDNDVRLHSFASIAHTIRNEPEGLFV